MTVNIKEHYEALQTTHKDQLEQRRRERSVVLAGEQKLWDSMKPLKLERSKKQKLMAEVESEGLDASKLAERIQWIDIEIERISSEAQRARSQAREILEPAPPVNFERLMLLAEVMAVHGCNDAVAIESPNECWKHLPLILSAWDEQGTPTECRIGLGNCERPIPIKPSEVHRLRAFRPKALSWLPATQDSECCREQDDMLMLVKGFWVEKLRFGRSYDRSKMIHGMTEGHAFLDKSGQLFISTTEFSWRQGGSECDDDFKDVAESLERRFEQLLAQSGG